MPINPQTYQLTESGKTGKICLGIGIAGLSLSAIAFALTPERAFQSYLLAFVFWTSIALGALFFTMLHHMTGAVWSVVIRRISESLMANLPVMVIFFIPLIFGLKSLHSWARPEEVAKDALLQAKTPYLNVVFFLLRTVGYFAIWYWLVRSLYRTSLAQDQRYDESQVKRLRNISAPGMILFALTCTFAAIDWLMALDPHWYSTIYGVYFFAGSVSAALPSLTLTAIYLQKKGALVSEITPEHYHDLGKLTFAFLILWSYMAFSQYFLIWYGNLPEETVWMHSRWTDSWKPVSIFLPLAHFVVPFVVLMSRAAKRNLRILTWMGFWILLTHWVDLSWLILPNFKHQGAIYVWSDITCTVGLGGIFVWLFWRRLRAHALVPINDPQLGASIQFVNI